MTPQIRVRDTAVLGVITALPVETLAIEAIFDHIIKYDIASDSIVPNKCYIFHTRDSNDKTITVALIELASMGNNHAAIAATILLTHFKNIQTLCFCGIAGSCPVNKGNSTTPINEKEFENHALIGDTVVSTGGIFQYDMVKHIQDGIIEAKSIPISHAVQFKTALNLLFRDISQGNFSLKNEIENAYEKGTLIGWHKPDLDKLSLYTPSFRDKNNKIINKRKPSDIPNYREYQKERPYILGGSIGSANMLLKNFEYRDELKNKHDILAVEMEGSGISDAAWTFNCSAICIRGICDYADFKKGNKYREYASLSASATLKALINRIPFQKE